MKVSVCIPVYGVEKYIERCARSLFEQTMKDDIEFIFVDDCTPDKSMEILQNVLEEYPERKNQVKIIHHEVNKGLTGARNTALKAASGDYIIHCDSDDWVDPEYCKALYETAIDHHADVVACPIFLEYNGVRQRELTLPSGGIIDEWFHHSFHKAEFNSLCNKLFIRQIALDPSLHVPGHITMAEDLLRTTQMLLKCKIAIYCDRVHYHYFFSNSGSSTLSFTEKNYRSARDAAEILFPLFPEKFQKQHNVCLGLLLFTALCTHGLESVRIRNIANRREHFLAISNSRIHIIKRFVLAIAFLSIPLAQFFCNILVMIKERSRCRSQRG